MNRSFWLFILLICGSAPVLSQKYQPFSGKLVYRIELFSPVDSSTTFQSFTTLYTDDTLVRIETESQQFGGQLLIKHLIFRKYYLLLEMNGQKYAIQQHMPPDTIPSKYTFKKKWGRKKIAGQKARRVIVNTDSYEKPLEMWYLPSISPKYLDAVQGIPGLPVDYYVQMEDGYLHYTLESMEMSPVNKDLFGIPSDFRKVSFDEFMEEMMPKE